MRLKNAYQKKAPPMMISVDKMHQEYIGIETIRDFIDGYFDQFPGEILSLHSFVSNKADEVKELLSLFNKEIISGSEYGDDVSELQFRFYKLRKGELNVIYEPLLQLGKAKHLTQDLKDRYLTAGKNRQKNDYLKWMGNFSISSLQSSFAIRSDGEFLINSLFMSEHMFTMGNIEEKTIEQAIEYANRNSLFRTIVSEDGPQLIYEIADELGFFIQDDLDRIYYFEEFMTHVLKDPINRLAVLVKILESQNKEKLVGESLLNDLDIDFDFIYSSLRNDTKKNKVKTLNAKNIIDEINLADITFAQTRLNKLPKVNGLIKFIDQAI